jgi:transcriptional regulator with XRE-family HTH domain
MSQEELGFSAGLHPTEVSRLERATREPRLGTIVKLARALELKPSALLDGIA